MFIIHIEVFHSEGVYELPTSSSPRRTAWLLFLCTFSVNGMEAPNSVARSSLMRSAVTHSETSVAHRVAPPFLLVDELGRKAYITSKSSHTSVQNYRWHVRVPLLLCVMLPWEESCGQISATVKWISAKTIEATRAASLAHVFFMKQAVCRRRVGRVILGCVPVCQPKGLEGAGLSKKKKNGGRSHVASLRCAVFCANTTCSPYQHGDRFPTASATPLLVGPSLRNHRFRHR